MLKSIMVAKKNGGGRYSALYQTVPVEALQQTRKGKHYDFVSGVLSDLEVLKPGSAIKIPLEGVKGISVVKLRAAINRATAAKGMKISTSSDAGNFYVWRQK